jgi:hypothetical protein
MDFTVFGSCGAHAWTGDAMEKICDQNDHRIDNRWPTIVCVDEIHLSPMPVSPFFVLITYVPEQKSSGSSYLPSPNVRNDSRSCWDTLPSALPENPYCQPSSITYHTVDLSLLGHQPMFGQLSFRNDRTVVIMEPKAEAVVNGLRQ